MPNLIIAFLSVCFGLSVGLLALETAQRPWLSSWGQRLALWRQRQVDRLQRLGLEGAQAQVGWRPVALGAGFGLLAAFVLQAPLLLPLGLGLGMAWPPLKEAQLRALRARRMGEQMPGLFEALAAALRAGQSLSQALAAAAEDLPAPVAQLMQDAALRVGLGEDPEMALHNAGLGLDATLQADWRMLCTAVAVVRSSGGKLPELLDQLAATVRERQRLQAMIRAQTAQAKLSGWIVGCLPPLLLVAMQALDPDLVAPLFHTSTGWAILALAAGMEGAGLLVLRKMAEVQA